MSNTSEKVLKSFSGDELLDEDVMSDPKVRKAHGNLVGMIKDIVKSPKKVRVLLDAVTKVMNTIDAK